MKNTLRLVLINALVLVGILCFPALAFDVYKRIKLSFEPSSPTDDLRLNPAYPTLEDRQKAEAMASDTGAGMSYKSFVGWRRNSFSGVHKNVLEPYRNRLSALSRPNNSVWFFGGSTMWGTGATDMETIPSWYAKKTNSYVFNLGESGWVSRQSLNQLISLLGDGLSPEKIIFYSGVNDVLHGCRAENASVPAHVKEKTIKDKLEYTNYQLMMSTAVPVRNFLIAPYKAIGGKLGLQISKHKNYGGMDCTTNSRKVELIADHLINNWYVAYLLAVANEVEFLAILQPQVFSSKVDKDYLNKGDFYLEAEYAVVYPVIKRKMRESCEFDDKFCQRLLVGTTWLDQLKKPVYKDFCHITGAGNEVVAAQIVKHTSN